jgi:signal transduction histidine kinase
MARIVVAPREECELLEDAEGAYVNVLTLATNEMECRTKVGTAMNDYRIEVVAIEDVFLFSDALNVSAELTTIAEELEESQNLKHVRFSTFHKFPRVM